MNTQDLLNTILIVTLIVITSCIVFITFFLIQALKAIANLADNIEDVTEGLKNKIQFKALAAVPAILVTLLSKFLRKRG